MSDMRDDTREFRVWILRVAKVIVWLVYLFVLAAVVLLLIAFVLRLLGANPSASFTEWVYRSVDRIMEPFRGIFPSKPINNRSVLDWSLLFAAIMYTLFALVVHWVIVLVTRHLSRLTAKPPAPAPPAQPQPVYYVAAPPAATTVTVPPAPGSFAPAASPYPTVPSAPSTAPAATPYPAGTTYPTDAPPPTGTPYPSDAPAATGTLPPTEVPAGETDAPTTPLPSPPPPPPSSYASP